MFLSRAIPCRLLASEHLSSSLASLRSMAALRPGSPRLGTALWWRWPSLTPSWAASAAASPSSSSSRSSRGASGVWSSLSMDVYQVWIDEARMPFYLTKSRIKQVLLFNVTKLWHFEFLQLQFTRKGKGRSHYGFLKISLSDTALWWEKWDTGPDGAKNVESPVWPIPRNNFFLLSRIFLKIPLNFYESFIKSSRVNSFSL